MKKIIVFLLSLTIAFTPTFVFASSVGGWSMSNPIAQGASTAYTGIKNVMINGKEFVKKGTAVITPSANQVAKVLGRGVAGYALSVAVEQLLGAVSWVLDPENNQIKYWTTVQVFQSETSYNGSLRRAESQSEACQISVDFVKSNTAANYSKVILSSKNLSGNTLTCNIFAYRDSAPNSPLHFIHTWGLTEVQEDKPKTIPLPDVAQQVINNANNDDANAKVATTTAAADIVAEAEKDSTKAPPIVNQLENSASTENADSSAQEKANEATGTTKPNTETGETELALEFPKFCGWAPTICEAAQTVISFPQTLTNWWDTANEKSENWSKSIADAYAHAKSWFIEEPVYDKEELEIEEPEEFDTSVFSKDRFAVSRQCPVPEKHTISLSGVSVDFSFDLTPICTVFEFARPALVACSYLYAAYIVIGAARNG